jgi:2-aminobenzoate-CoA ligase
MVALWFAVLKAGGVVVCTMPLLRARELTFTADKARIRLAITDARIAEECEQAMRAHANGAIRDDARPAIRRGGAPAARRRSRR